MVCYRIVSVSVSFCQYRYCIISREKIKGTHPYYHGCTYLKELTENVMLFGIDHEANNKTTCRQALSGIMDKCHRPLLAQAGQKYHHLIINYHH